MNIEISLNNRSENIEHQTNRGAIEEQHRRTQNTVEHLDMQVFAGLNQTQIEQCGGEQLEDCLS